MSRQLFEIQFYISWRLEKKQNPALAFLSEKAKNLIEKEMELKVIRPIFSRKLTPSVGNPIIKKFHNLLADFKFEDKCAKFYMRDTDAVENFAVQDFGHYIIGQYLLHFKIFNKGKETGEGNYGHFLPILLREIGKIKVEEDGVILRITGSRTFGEVLQDPENWPHDADTVM